MWAPRVTDRSKFKMHPSSACRVGIPVDLFLNLCPKEQKVCLIARCVDYTTTLYKNCAVSDFSIIALKSHSFGDLHITILLLCCFHNKKPDQVKITAVGVFCQALFQRTSDDNSRLSSYRLSSYRLSSYSACVDSSARRERGCGDSILHWAYNT